MIGPPWTERKGRTRSLTTVCSAAASFRGLFFFFPLSCSLARLLACSLDFDVISTFFQKNQQSTGKTAFDVDIDGMEEQPWRHPGVDIADFFNYGFTEDSWRVYCEKQLR